MLYITSALSMPDCFISAMFSYLDNLIISIMPVSPRTAGFIVRAARAAKAAYCFWLNNQLKNNRDPYNDWIREYSKFANNPTPIFPGAIIAATACDISPPPLTDDDFRGGQCECVEYVVTLEYRHKFDEVVTTGIRVRGPVKGSYMSELDIGLGEPSPAFYVSAKVLADAGTCEPREYLIRADPDLLWGRIIRVERVDGLPDDCGDPPPPPPPPLGDRFGWNFDWEDADGKSRTTDVTVTIGPVNFSPTGELNFSVNMDFVGNISLNFNFNSTGDRFDVQGPRFYFDRDGSDGSGTADRRYFSPGGDGREGEQPDDFTTDPSSPLPEGDDLDIPGGSKGDDYEGEEPDQPEKVKVIRGVAITTISVNSNRPTVIFQDGNPDIYVPSLGYINFRVKIGDNTTFWTNDLPVKNVKSFIPCPWEGGAIEVKGTPQPGVRWILTPVYSRSELPLLSL